MNKLKLVEDRTLYIKKRVQDLVIDLIDSDFKKIDQQQFIMKSDATKLAMNHLRDIDLAKRISAGQNIRIFNIISEDKEQLKRYIEISMPQIIPQLKNHSEKS